MWHDKEMFKFIPILNQHYPINPLLGQYEISMNSSFKCLNMRGLGQLVGLGLEFRSSKILISCQVFFLEQNLHTPEILLFRLLIFCMTKCAHGDLYIFFRDMISLPYSHMFTPRVL